MNVFPQTIPLGGQSEAAAPITVSTSGPSSLTSSWFQGFDDFIQHRFGGADEAGPSFQGPPVHNLNFESSLRSRIVKLEYEKCIFLLDKKKGEYWAEIKEALDQASGNIT